jgi:hypothetical protein
VPLTFDQVKTQLPHKTWEPQWVKKNLYSWIDADDSAVWVEDVSKMSRWALQHHENEDFDEDASVEPQDGCDPYWLEVFGPALTRLTANQAVNMLQVTNIGGHWGGLNLD